MQTLQLEQQKPAATRQAPPRRTRRALHAHARAAVLGGLILFVAAQVGMRAWIENSRPEMRDPGFEIKYRQLKELLDRSAETPALVVFTGSSMTAHGMKADMVDAPLSDVLKRPAIGFNLGTSAAGPFTQMMYYRRLLRRGVRPDLAVVELSPLLYDFPDASSDIGRFPAYVLDRHDLEIVERYAAQPDLREEWWQSYLVPVYAHRLAVLNQTAPNFVPFADRLELWHDMDEHGWRKLRDRNPAARAETLKAMKQAFHNRFQTYQVGEPPVKALRELIDLLKSEKIPTILVLMPEGPLMHSSQVPERLAPLLAEFRAISESSGFPLIDARTWCGEEHFSDSAHLYADGAEILTGRLLREVILPRQQRSAQGAIAASRR